jgi:hypothetical protein
MSLVEERARLAAQQAELVASLLGSAAPPPGFDEERLQAAAEALAIKRERSLAKAWPALAASLRDRFHPQFAAYAASHPLPPGGPKEDGFRFAKVLLSTGSLPDDGHRELLALSLRHSLRGDGLRRRAAPALVAGVLRQSPCLVVGFRVPMLGERWLSIPLMRSLTSR